MAFGKSSHHRIFNTTLVLFLLHFGAAEVRAKITCLENGRFYRDPNRSPQKIWSASECSKYFLCLEGEVFDFKCSPGLLFDVQKQICDFKPNVHNCDITSETITPAASLKKNACTNNQLACEDGTCLPQSYFCDGSEDCIDGSDEGYCDSSYDPNAALPCNQSTCVLPNCFCSPDGTQIPGNLLRSETPQMIILTFDGPINSDNWELYDKVLFDNWKNPNGCPIKSTLFVSHQFNNYQQTQKLWNKGHEIAVHSITRRSPESWWSNNATLEDWFDEMVGQANILHKYAKIRLSEIRGMRAPFLKVGWNRQFLMMKEFGFVYDSSIVAPFSNPPLWPYTLDHKIVHECSSFKQNCPSRSYPGVWEMVMNQLEADGYSCAMVDSCPPDLSGDDIYRILINNFNRHYSTNRAPFGLYFHSSWFKKQESLDAFQDFIAEVSQLPDVWFVTNSQAISWMKNPTPIKQLKTFKAWDCNTLFDQNEIACSVPNVCKLYSRVFQQERYLYTCFQCPKRYPWVKNEFGVEKNTDH